jgi:hypothetical protein
MPMPTERVPTGEGGMNDRERLNKLRALREQLKRLPPSAERDRMLREVGSRAVDLESSEPRATMRPLSAEPAPPAAAPPVPTEPAVQRARTTRRASPATRRPGTQGEAGRVRTRAAAADAFIASVRPTPALPEGLLLSLDDTPLPTGDQPWTRGLRG